MSQPINPIPTISYPDPPTQYPYPDTACYRLRREKCNCRSCSGGIITPPPEFRDSQNKIPEKPESDKSDFDNWTLVASNQLFFVDLRIGRKVVRFWLFNRKTYSNVQTDHQRCLAYATLNEGSIWYKAAELPDHIYRSPPELERTLCAHFVGFYRQ